MHWWINNILNWCDTAKLAGISVAKDCSPALGENPASLWEYLTNEPITWCSRQTVLLQIDYMLISQTGKKHRRVSVAVEQ